MTGDCHVQFGERLAGKFRWPTHLDLVQIQAGPIRQTLDGIRKALSWLGDFSYNQAAHSTHLTFKFSPEAAPETTLKVMVEINTREHKELYGIKKYAFGIQSGWYEARTEIASYEPEELFGTKLRALLQRRKNRDLFDLNEGLKQLSLDQKKVVAAFAHYLSLQKLSISRAMAEQRMLEKLQKSLMEDIAPLLPVGVIFNGDEALAAFNKIWFELIELIPGEPWKLSQKIIEQLREGNMPNLLLR